MLNDILSDPGVLDVIQVQSGEDTIPYFVQLIDSDHKHQVDTNDTFTQAQLLQNADFKNIAEHILEGTLYNLMNEALHNEFDICEMPPLVVSTEAKHDRLSALARGNSTKIIKSASVAAVKI